MDGGTHSVPTRTITIDVEAYERLKSVQKPDESFSRTIKRVIRRPTDLRAWFAAMDHHVMSRGAAEAIAEQRSRRSRRGPRAR
jgi:predicted CopG family antitoxin